MDVNEKGTQSLHRLLDLVEALAAFPKGISLMELSKKCGLPKSTAHRMLGCLLERNYIYQNKTTGEYSLSLKLFEISSSVQQTELLAIARPYLDSLSEKLQETVHFVVMDNADVVYLYKKIPMGRSSQMSSIIGARSPMYRTAVGKSILSAMDELEVESVWNASVIEKKTYRTITALEELKRELALVREYGYAVDNEENELGIKCVAFPLVAPGLTPSAFSVSGLSPQMTEAKIKRIVPLAKEVQKKIYKDLGIL